MKKILMLHLDSNSAKDGYRADMVIYDEAHTVPCNMLIIRRECHEALHQHNRKEEYNRLCSRISQ